MFPIRDENPTLHPPIMTWCLIGACVLSWVFLQGMGAARPLAQSLCLFGMVPGQVLGFLPAGTRIPVGSHFYCVLPPGHGLHTMLTHMFMHGGWLHLIGNMWFLWVFGDNVEDVLGPLKFLLLYLLCGLVAASAQIATDWTSALPMVGASGAIGGVMGAYGRLFPGARIQTLIFLGFFATFVSVPAMVMLGYWFVFQILAGLPALAGSGGGIAFWAHVGGFASGYLLVPLFGRRQTSLDW